MLKVKICRECNKPFPNEPRANGQPNGVGFELENGEVYYLCIDCFEKWLNAKKEEEIMMKFE